MPRQISLISSHRSYGSTPLKNVHAPIVIGALPNAAADLSHLLSPQLRQHHSGHSGDPGAFHFLAHPFGSLRLAEDALELDELGELRLHRARDLLEARTLLPPLQRLVLAVLVHPQVAEVRDLAF